jgi:transposase
VAATLIPPEGMTHWSARRLAKQVGVSHSTVHRIWQAHDLKPHRVETFKFSRDPQLREKVIDIVGLYLNPPEQALVLGVDEKSQIQALERTQPLLQLRPGQVERHTHDYKRNGTTTLFAALNIATGEVIGECHPRHRHQEFLKFLNQLNKEVPDKELHLILDNYGTHKQEKVQRWLKRHKRFHLHFTPIGASWLNMVEIWFGILTNQAIRRGSFGSVGHLIGAIKAFLSRWNEGAKPFVWTKTAEQILARAAR